MKKFVFAPLIANPPLILPPPAQTGDSTFHARPAVLKAELHVSGESKLAGKLGAEEANRILAWLATNLRRRVKSLAALDSLSEVPVACGTHAVKMRLQPQESTPSSP